MKKGYITQDEMNIITDTVLAKAGLPTTWQGTVNKTDIDTLIEFEYGIDIVWENIDHFAPDEEVFAALMPKRKLIYMNEAKRALFINKMGTMNFSKAHELGHWILHITEQRDYEQLTFLEDQTYFCRSVSKKHPQEIQADMFAASILMPKDIISCAVNKLKERGRVTFPNLYKLRDEFEVSISALTIRIQELKLLYITAEKEIFFSEVEAAGQMSIT
jgi:Zn-dependent peptidase ImmA (M78 family)